LALTLAPKSDITFEGQNVDVVVLTKNSQRILKNCLDSIYANIPVSRLIIFDGYSTDKTLGILDEFQRKFGNIVVFQGIGTRGMARQKAIERVETEWFVFVDSDVVLSRNWFRKAWRLVKEDVGAVWGMEIWSVLRKTRILRLFERVNLRVFENRGGTHDILIRHKAVEDVSIPPCLHTYEDSYIKSWIHRKCYKVVAVYDPYCIHYRPENVWTVKESIRMIAGDLKFALGRPELMLSYVFFTIIVLHQTFARKLPI
jgi:glycosyltransferase involved in cell wall biosynthesis